ncbi:MAG: DUF1275 domain-containing protein [Oscillospiraceae bacterium]|nr:DUF1275 domain-containing protein [Oscillospiraceae bacterium]
MKHPASERILFLTMALIGGFFGGYTVARCGVLASAETVNLICLAQAILELNLPGILMRVGAAAIFALAIGISTLLSIYKSEKLAFYALLFDAVGIVLTGLLPAELGFFALYPIFFVTGFQWNAFSGADGYASSCVFSTNNFRQAIIGLTLFLRTGDRAAGKRAGFFGLSLLFFHIGVVLAFLGMRTLSIECVFLCLLPVALAGWMKLTQTTAIA